MEKYFQFIRGTEAHADYLAYHKFKGDLQQAVQSFLKEQNIGSDTYAVKDRNLSIVPTKEDRIRFQSMFLQKELGHGLKTFRQNSVVGKAWREKMKSLAPIKPVKMWYYCIGLTGKFQERIFVYEGNIYASVCFGSPEKEFLYDTSVLTEISKIEFDKMMVAQAQAQSRAEHDPEPEQDDAVEKAIQNTDVLKALFTLQTANIVPTTFLNEETIRWFLTKIKEATKKDMLYKEEN